MYKAGDAINNWVIERQLGRGGMGAVFLAHNKYAPRIKAAVKILSSHQIPQASERFIREAEILCQLDHPNIVRVRDIHMGDGPTYLVMDLVEGESLEERVERGPTPSDVAVRYIRQLADALHYAHEQQIWHRDIKPANVLLRSDGQPILVDFGIAHQEGDARLTQTGMLAPASVPYAPPEWLRPGALDPRKGDIYSLGVVLYELLLGKLAFEVDASGGNLQRALLQLALAKQEMPALDPGGAYLPPVRRLVMTMTAPDPANRLASMTVVRQRCDALLTAWEEAPQARPSTRAARAPDAARPPVARQTLAPSQSVDRPSPQRPRPALRPPEASAAPPAPQVVPEDSHQPTGWHKVSTDRVSRRTPAPALKPAPPTEAISVASLTDPAPGTTSNPQPLLLPDPEPEPGAPGDPAVLTLGPVEPDEEGREPGVWIARAGFTALLLALLAAGFGGAWFLSRPPQSGPPDDVGQELPLPDPGAEAPEPGADPETDPAAVDPAAVDPAAADPEEDAPAAAEVSEVDPQEVEVTPAAPQTPAAATAAPQEAAPPPTEYVNILVYGGVAAVTLRNGNGNTLQIPARDGTLYWSRAPYDRYTITNIRFESGTNFAQQMAFSPAAGATIRVQCNPELEICKQL